MRMRSRFVQFQSVIHLFVPLNRFSFRPAAFVQNKEGMSSTRTKSNGRDSLPEPKPKVPLRRWEEEQDDDLFDPDKLLQCPYDSNHKIRACRLPYHLIKCKKNNPQLASELWTCPFNARHLMPKHELSGHMSTCVDRCSVNTDYGKALYDFVTDSMVQHFCLTPEKLIYMSFSD